MAKINLRDYYPDYYKSDYIVDVSEEVLFVMQRSKQKEAAYQRKLYRYKAHYSLYCDDGIEQDALMGPLTPEEIYEDNERYQEIERIFQKLPEIQSHRIRARYYDGMSVADIARKEGVARSRVDESIRRGLHNLFVFIKK